MPPAFPWPCSSTSRAPRSAPATSPAAPRCGWKPGSTVVVTGEAVPCTADTVSVSWPELTGHLAPGPHLLIADGLIDLEVTSVAAGTATCVVRSGGELGSHKNVNVPGVRTSLPAVTERDAEHLRFAVRLGFDFVAASFVRRPEDVVEVRMRLFDLGSRMHVIAKIEDEEGLANAPLIARVADGIMVARGDLGVRLSVEDIPLAQKRIIAACQGERKPVITATQMLDSMIRNPRPDPGRGHGRGQRDLRRHRRGDALGRDGERRAPRGRRADAGPDRPGRGGLARVRDGGASPPAPGRRAGGHGPGRGAQRLPDRPRRARRRRSSRRRCAATARASWRPSVPRSPSSPSPPTRGCAGSCCSAGGWCP